MSLPLSTATRSACVFSRRPALHHCRRNLAPARWLTQQSLRSRKFQTSCSTEDPSRSSDSDSADSTSQRTLLEASAQSRAAPATPAAAPSGVLLALGSVALGVAVFVATRLGGPGAVTFETLQGDAMPLSAAIANGRPTVVEFYASWCEVCRELLPDTVAVERAYKDKVNFVALNVDNSKWAPEVAEYGVNGIPQYVFLGPDSRVQASAAGKVPRQVLEQNAAALAEGRALPYARVRAPGSELPTLGATTAPRAQADPRAHG